MGIDEILIWLIFPHNQFGCSQPEGADRSASAEWKVAQCVNSSQLYAPDRLGPLGATRGRALLW